MVIAFKAHAPILPLAPFAVDWIHSAFAVLIVRAVCSLVQRLLALFATVGRWDQNSAASFSLTSAATRAACCPLVPVRAFAIDNVVWSRAAIWIVLEKQVVPASFMFPIGAFTWLSITRMGGVNFSASFIPTLARLEIVDVAITPFGPFSPNAVRRFDAWDVSVATTSLRGDTTRWDAAYIGLGIDRARAILETSVA